MFKTDRLKFALAAGILLVGGVAHLARAQVNNPGVSISGAVSAGNVAVFGPGTGQIQDGGVVPLTKTLLNTHIFVGNASNVATDVAMSQDCAISNTGVITCTKTNNVSFAASATTDTTNAANISSGTLPLGRLALANGLIYIGSAGGNPAAQTMSQDCAITNAGVITCTKTNNVSFAASATTDTTNASNIGSGTLNTARLPSPFTSGTIKGNTSTFMTGTAAAVTTGHAAVFDANGNLIDGGSAGTGTVTSAQVSAGTGISVSGTCTITTSGNCTVATNITKISASLGSDVALNNTGLYFDGPNTAQGISGTWLASGTVTLVDTAGGALFYCKLWDGTSQIASGAANSNAAGFHVTITLSGALTTAPTGNLRISCRDLSSTSGIMQFNTTGLSTDSTITSIRLN